mmetsp:Transcript_7243/g.22075  ORF Transcript_7243/g.22075 Transcript_7243/m.22075 type:complete len:475 (-) Transcript_7243:178-1602(-)
MSFAPLKFAWSPREGAPEAEYEVCVQSVETGPAPERFLVFVLKIRNSAGDEYVTRKTPLNFDHFQREIIRNCPQWPSARLQAPTGRPRNPFAAILAQKLDLTDEKQSLAAWNRCLAVVEEFLRDYRSSESTQVLAQPGRSAECQGDSIGLHLRVCFRCLFFMQRIPDVDRLDATGKWRIENSFQLQNEAGNRLFMRHFNPIHAETKEPKDASEADAIVMLIHGYADQGDGDAFVHLAKRLNEQNLAVFSLDCRGCGRSEGPRMVVRDYDDIVSDHNLLFNAILNRYPDKKIFLIGHSMGGGISIMLSLKRKDVSGMILVSPMVQVSEKQSPFMQKIAPIIANLAPESKIVALDVTLMSHDPYHQRRHRFQAYGYTERIVSCTGYQMLKLCQDISPKLSEITTQFVVFHATDDLVTCPEASKALYKEASAEDKTLELVEGAYHEVIGELDELSRPFFEKSIHWLKKRVQISDLSA